MRNIIIGITLIIVATLAGQAVRTYVIGDSKPVPVETAPSETAKGTITVSLGNPFMTDNVMIVVTDVLEDSRCPSDVQCFQAGTVRIALKTETPAGVSTSTLKIGEHAVVDGFGFSFDDAKPHRVSTSQISKSDYGFVFGILEP